LGVSLRSSVALPLCAIEERSLAEEIIEKCISYILSGFPHLVLFLNYYMHKHTDGLTTSDAVFALAAVCYLQQTSESRNLSQP
jgi:hypothetical protein